MHYFIRSTGALPFVVVDNRNVQTRLSNFFAEANTIADSLNTSLSCTLPSPNKTKVLNFFLILAACAIPHPIGKPWPSDPVGASTPFTFGFGCLL